MNDFKQQIEDLYIDEVNYLLIELQGDLPFLIAIPDGYTEINQNNIDYDKLRILLYELGDSDEQLQKRMIQLLENFRQKSSEREVLADIGPYTASVLLTVILSIAWVQMSADQNRKEQPDEKINPDGSVERRTYFSTESVLEKIKGIIKAATPEFLEAIKQALKAMNKNGASEEE